MLEIKNLNHAFEDKDIFVNAKLIVESGEIIWLQGENGSGKTTLFRILSGIISPSSTQALQICFDGMEITLEELKNKVNYIPNKPYLFEYLSGLDNMNYLISLFDLGEQYDNILRNLKAFGLEADMEHDIHTYSLGMKAKLYLGVMLERKAELLLIDEILNNVDKESLEIILEILRNKLKEGTSIIFSSHVKMNEEIKRAKSLFIINRRIEYEQI